MYRHLLIAVDGSDCSTFAAKQGAALANFLQARVTFITVSSTWQAIGLSELALGHLEDEYTARAEAYAKECLSKVEAFAVEAGLVFDDVHLFSARPHEAILTTAEQHRCDLIVVGSHGRRGLERLMLGSEASKVVALSTISVLIVRESFELQGVGISEAPEHALN